MQVFVFVSLKKIKLKQKCLDLRRDRLNWAQETSPGVMLLNIHFFLRISKDTKGLVSPLPRCGENKPTGGRVPVYVSAGERGRERT